MTERRTYSQEQRAEALALYVSDGLGAASRTLDIPQGTIAAWAARTPGVHTAALQKRSNMAEAFEAQQLRMVVRQADLAEQFSLFADTMVAAAFDHAEGGTMRDAKDAIIAAGIAVDKAQLLSGGATGRIEHSDANGELAAEVARLVEERRSVAPGTVSMDSRRTA